MPRALAALLLLLLLTSLPGERAAAYDTWCADDPVVRVGDHLLDIQVQVPVAEVATLRSTQLTVIIPQNVSGAVVVDGVSAFPMATTVVASGAAWDGVSPLPVRLELLVQAAASFPVRLTAIPLTDGGMPLAGPPTAVGTTNAHLVVELGLGS